MRSLVIMEQGLELGIQGEEFEIRKSGAAIERVRVADISEVLVFGAVALTPACISLLLARGIDTIFLTAKGMYRGRLAGPASKNVELRLAQFSRWQDGAAREMMARAIVRGKIANQRNLLLRSQRELKLDRLASVVADMRRLLDSLESRTGIDTIRGVEGQAAAAYFGALGACIRNPAFSFTRRTRRPPRDPANAMLSFGYTILNLAMESAVARAGLDPMLGSFHSPEFGRPSLSLDLIEEFRPLLVDSLVLRLINRKQVGPEDFENPLGDEEPAWFGEGPEIQTEQPHEPRPVWLAETGRRIFFREWGRRLRESVFYEPRQEVRTMEEIMRFQVYHYARIIKGEESEYRAFVPR
jgi:CRISPR-associated protein Cas1